MSRNERRQFEREQKKGVLSKGNKSKNSNYLVLVVLFIAFLLSRLFIASETVGEDYSLYITIIPTFLGLVALGIYKKTFLREKLQTTNKFLEKTIIIFLYGAQGILFSFLSFGLFINTSWHIANNSVAKNSRQEFYNCSITGFYTPRSGPSVFYKFKDYTELHDISYKKYNILRGEDLKKFTINLTVRKGIGNCYIVDNFIIY